MKKTAIVMAVLSGMAVSCVANAATSRATMKIEGTIVPATCDISLNGGTSATLTLGKVSAAQLVGNSFTELPSQSVSMNVNCPSPTVVGFQAMDLGEKAGEVDLAGTKDPSLFSLGTTKSGAIAGGYFVSFGSGKVDSRNIVNFIASDTGENWSDMSGKAISASKKQIYSWSAESGKNAPTLGFMHQVQLQINSYINPLSDKDLSDKIDLRGEATYDLVYL